MKIRRYNVNDSDMIIGRIYGKGANIRMKYIGRERSLNIHTRQNLIKFENLLPHCPYSRSQDGYVYFYYKSTGGHGFNEYYNNLFKFGR